MNQEIFNFNKRFSKTYVDLTKTKEWIDGLFTWLFSIGKQYDDFKYFLNEEHVLKNQLYQIVCSQLTSKDAELISDALFQNLFSIRQTLEEDLDAIISFDPAAKSRNEVLWSYPGFYAIFAYRVAHFLLKQQLPIIPRVISEHIHTKTGIDIHPGAEIGRKFFIDHGTGVVIGETTVIGNEVKIYQGVTLGALTVKKSEAQQKRHPTIGNNVIIYANATILGGETEIGNHSIIGGNVWITDSVPKNTQVYHKAEVIIKNTSI